MFRRNQSVVKYISSNEIICFGSVKDFVQFTDTANAIRNLALVVPFKCNYQESNRIHLVFPEKGSLNAIPIATILNVCIIVEVDDSTFVCEIPNSHDRD